MLNLPSLRDIDIALAERSLAQYTKQAWEIVEPATDYIHGWHIDAICDHLEAATRGEIQYLIINIPPRCMKSLLACVMWPTWVWATKPATRWLFSSYAETLAIRDALKCRRILESPWYRWNWGHMFRLTGDQNQKSRFENDKTGFRLATGVGGGNTGEGGDFIVVDDPLKAKDAHSDAMRNEVNDWWSGTMSTRGNNPKQVVKVVIMQRLHDDDLTGNLLAKARNEGVHYEHLCLPMEYEPGRCHLTTGWKEPRAEPGELLWMQRYDAEDVDKLKLELGPQDSASQLQQRPTPEGGGIFKSDWWDIVTGRNRYDMGDKAIANKTLARWLFVDSAFKDKDSNDYSAVSVLELWPDYRLALRSVWMERILSAFLPDKLDELARRWNVDGKLRGVVVEDKGSGTTAIQSLRATAPAWLAEMIFEFQPNGTKEYRARQASIWCGRDCILFPYPSPETTWIFDTIDGESGQLFRFPNAAHDDFVDTLTMAIIYLEHYLEQGYHARMGQT
jgi:hypothetical protein